MGQNNSKGCNNVAKLCSRRPDRQSPHGASSSRPGQSTSGRTSSNSIAKKVMGNANLKQHIETAQKTGACQLKSLNLKEVPEDLQKLKTLRTVDLSDNKIPQLPPWFIQFGFMKNLTMNNTKLESLPENIGQLKKLEVIHLCGNMLDSIPESFSNLTNLKALHLSSNRLKVFPPQLLGLQMLDLIDLSQNAITDLPEDMSELQATELNLNQNQVSRLPNSLAKCQRLKVLRVEENCLDISAFTPEIMKESKISLFAVDGNMFSTKAFTQKDGYDEYQERYTATKKKFN